MIRAVLIALVVVGACFISKTYSEHHAVSNETAFTDLYGHVLPAPLVKHGHHDGEEDHGGLADHALLAIPLPGFLAFFDGDRDPDNAVHLVFTNLQVFQLAALLLIVIAFSGVPAYLRTGEGDKITRVLTGWCMWIRDEMVYPVMGKEDGAKFLPFFLFMFFFIVFMNLMGLVPESATATASIFVTAALALITFGSMIGCGMAAQGPVAFFKNLVPHVPAWLWPLLFVIEIIGLLVKPFALMIRLFANLTGGHLVVLSFLALIFFFAGVEKSAAGGYGIMPVAVAFGAFIMIIEGFVALVQAFIFTQLSIIFIGASIHPEH